jgi:hypothetical protein
MEQHAIDQGALPMDLFPISAIIDNFADFHPCTALIEMPQSQLHATVQNLRDADRRRTGSLSLTTS